MENTNKENEVIKTKNSTTKRKTTTKNKGMSATTGKNSTTKSKTTTKKASSTSSKKLDTRKEVEKKKSNKEGMVNMFNKLSSTIKRHKVASIISASVVILLLITLIIIPIITSNKKVITIDGYDYSNKDFMIYLYSVKYNYFGKDNTNLPEATLNTLVDESSEKTISDFLKEKTVDEIKMAAIIQKLADEYQITLTNEEKQEIEEEKQEFIQNLGGKTAFKKMLRDNNTDEEAYNKMARTDKLYKLIYNQMYTEGKSNDLTEEEKETAKVEYYNNYKKIRQIVLSTVDLDTQKSLDTTTINQKETLANTILNEAKNGVDFNELIKKYSEDATNTEGPYEIYYQDGQLLEEVESAVNKLNIGDISEVVKSKYAFHIIIRDELDDSKLEEVYNQKREGKLLENISAILKEVPIIYHDSYTNIKIK